MDLTNILGLPLDFMTGAQFITLMSEVFRHRQQPEPQPVTVTVSVSA